MGLAPMAIPHPFPQRFQSAKKPVPSDLAGSSKKPIPTRSEEDVDEEDGPSTVRLSKAATDLVLAALPDDALLLSLQIEKEVSIPPQPKRTRKAYLQVFLLLLLIILACIGMAVAAWPR
jgi:hypothetical protein